MSRTCRLCIFKVLLVLQMLIILPANAEELTLVSGNGYAPFSGEDLPQGGMITEMVRAVFEKMGDTIRVDYKPWKRGYEEARENKYFGTYPYSKNEERVREFLFSDPIYISRAVFFVHRDSTIHYKNDKDLKGFTVCKALGFNTADIQHLLDAKIVTLNQLPSLDKCLRMLEAKRVDLVPINETVGKALIRSLYGANSNIFKTLDKPLDESTVAHFIVSKKQPRGEEIVQRFNASLSELKKNGTLHAIADKHLH